MFRKAYVTLTVCLVMDIEEGVSIGDVINDMNYDFTPDNPLEVDIFDTEITGYEVTYSK